MGTLAGTRRPTARAQQLRNEATPAERRLWQHLARNQLGVRFNRQMPVGPYIVDFLSRSAKLAIELDGESHTASIEHDAQRTSFLQSRGLTVLRFTNADAMTNQEGVVATIRTALTRSPSPDPSRKREGRPFHSNGGSA